MREIKFRGREFPGSWLYGDLINYENKNPSIRNVETWLTKDVIPETVGQFTGLRDRNGVEIWEGDIYHQGDRRLKYTVVWHDTGFMGKQHGCYGSYAGLKHFLPNIEVIGNIYENPELLEVTK